MRPRGRGSPAEDAVRERTFLGIGAEPGDLNLRIVTAHAGRGIVLALFEGLTAIGEDLRVRPVETFLTHCS